MPDYAKIVPEALDRALEGGYDLTDWPSFTVANDLMDLDQACEGADAADLIPHIEAWQAHKQAMPD